MVTWGPNTTHTFPGGTPSAPGFGTPAPTGSSLFGSSPAPAYGTPSAAPGSGGLFGASPAPVPGGSIFGTPVPSAGGSLFGASSSPAAGSSLFGAPAPSLYGAPSPSMFGGYPGAPAAQPQVPAQAALQAHMDASARQEAERVRSALERLHSAYAGTALPSTQEESNKFVAIVYNPLTPEQRQLQWINGMGNGGTILAPDRPPQVSEKQWKKAVVENSDPQNYMPNALVGAMALNGRVAWQQDRAKELATHAATLQKSQETIQQRSVRALQEVEEKARRHGALRKRLMDVMRRVELARCMNQPIQPDELKALERLGALYKEIESVRGVLISLQDKARTQTATSAKTAPLSNIPESAQLIPVLKEQRHKLETLTVTVQRDQRDMALIQQRTIGNALGLTRA